MSDSWLKPYEEALPSDMIVMPVIAYRIWYVPLQPILQMRSYHIQTPWTPCQRLEADAAITCRAFVLENSGRAQSASLKNHSRAHAMQAFTDGKLSTKLSKCTSTRSKRWQAFKPRNQSRTAWRLEKFICGAE